VQEESDPQVWSQSPQHLGHQLQLVVLHPYRGAFAGALGSGRGESFVDFDVGLPPRSMKGRRGDHIVVERPQCPVGEALVVVDDVLTGQCDRMQGDVAVDEWLHFHVRHTGPADPSTAAGAQERIQGGDQSTRTGLPPLRAIGQLFQVHRQPIGHHYETRLGGGGTRALGHGLASLVHAVVHRD
jgi:hypothetical protein